MKLFDEQSELVQLDAIMLFGMHVVGMVQESKS